MNSLNWRTCLRAACVVAVVCVSVSASSVRAQLLDRASSAVRGDDSSRSSSSSSSSSDDGILDSASSTARGSRSSSRSYRVRSDDQPSLAFGVAPSSRSSGYLGSGSAADGGLYVRAEVEGGYVVAGAGRVGAGLRLEMDAPIDLVARYSMFIEPRGTGTDFAALGRVGIDWRFLDTPDAIGRIGAAFRHFQDSAGGLLGADAMLGFDFLPGEPWVLSLEAGIGFVGAAMVVQLRASIGVLIDVLEIYAGYDYEGLFTEGNDVDLGGPMLGLRIWTG